MSLQVGLFVDGRNPSEWERPWSEHYPRLVEIAARFADLDAMYASLRELFDGSELTPTPLQEHLPIWLGYQQPIGARKAGRVGAGLLSIRRSCAEAYLEGLADGGHDPSAAR